MLGRRCHTYYKRTWISMKYEFSYALALPLRLNLDWVSQSPCSPEPICALPKRGHATRVSPDMRVPAQLPRDCQFDLPMSRAALAFPLCLPGAFRPCRRSNIECVSDIAKGDSFASPMLVPSPPSAGDRCRQRQFIVDSFFAGS